MEPPQPRSGEATLTPTSGNPPSGGEEGPNHKRETLPARLRRRHTHQLQPPWHYRRKPCVLRPPAESALPQSRLGERPRLNHEDRKPVRCVQPRPARPSPCGNRHSAAGRLTWIACESTIRPCRQSTDARVSHSEGAELTLRMPTPGSLGLWQWHARPRFRRGHTSMVAGLPCSLSSSIRGSSSCNEVTTTRSTWSSVPVTR
jgi:hypothetical protein